MSESLIRKRCATVILAITVLSGGCGEGSQRAALPSDSWYREIDNPRHEFIEYPLFLFSPVKPELIDEAVDLMNGGPLLQLSTSEARRYATDQLRTMRELRPFLIRGLYRSQKVFRVSIADRALWVDSADDPDDTVPVKRQPLVIYIDEVPPDVYVTVGSVAAAEQADAKDAPAD